MKITKIALFSVTVLLGQKVVLAKPNVKPLQVANTILMGPLILASNNMADDDSKQTLGIHALAEGSRMLHNLLYGFDKPEDWHHRGFFDFVASATRMRSIFAEIAAPPKPLLNTNNDDDLDEATKKKVRSTAKKISASLFGVTEWASAAFVTFKEGEDVDNLAMRLIAQTSNSLSRALAACITRPSKGTLFRLITSLGMLAPDAYALAKYDYSNYRGGGNGSGQSLGKQKIKSVTYEKYSKKLIIQTKRRQIGRSLKSSLSNNRFKNDEDLVVMPCGDIMTQAEFEEHALFTQNANGVKTYQCPCCNYTKTTNPYRINLKKIVDLGPIRKEEALKKQHKENKKQLRALGIYVSSLDTYDIKANQEKIKQDYEKKKAAYSMHKDSNYFKKELQKVEEAYAHLSKQF